MPNLLCVFCGRAIDGHGDGRARCRCKEKKGATYNPTPEEIAAQCEQIREGWDEATERRSRVGPGAVPAEIHVIPSRQQ